MWVKLKTLKLFYKRLTFFAINIEKFGEFITDSCILPLGELSEEVQKPCYKHYEKFYMRAETNRDLLNLSLLAMNPILCFYMKNYPKKVFEVLELLRYYNVTSL